MYPIIGIPCCEDEEDEEEDDVDDNNDSPPDVGDPKGKPDGTSLELPEPRFIECIFPKMALQKSVKNNRKTSLIFDRPFFVLSPLCFSSFLTGIGLPLNNMTGSTPLGR
jgi:hypothetical protein